MLDWIKENWNLLLEAYGALVAFCTIIVKITPSKKDDSIWGTIVKILDFFSTAFTDSDKQKLLKK